MAVVFPRARRRVPAERSPVLRPRRRASAVGSTSGVAGAEKQPQFGKAVRSAKRACASRRARSAGRGEEDEAVDVNRMTRDRFLIAGGE
ncbi:hypothetical protein PHLGIDRAFT_123680 [Phlebiopsis gigantea 11061_1 CR5-6]|uniref:Uncharacterized protein n=1 Tax=Phlebiopsis gigantea (strain 11061_1 CR5-6) TaxID=745531 RepID=A0A0C3P8W9_PHLG1|nr:hypothetical protein PHLGIDRAFT_123680 [Phlebiopsis gigantea 11061_1 CR5-6]